MNNKIYLLTDGDYSDYHIIGAFSSEERANEIKEKINYSSAQIEEFEIDLIGKDNRLQYYVSFKANDNNLYNFYYTDFDNEINKVRKQKISYARPQFEIYTVSVMAEDGEHAIKIAADLVAQYRVLNNE